MMPPQLNLELSAAKDPPKVKCDRYSCVYLGKQYYCKKRTSQHNRDYFDTGSCPFFDDGKEG